MCGINARHVGEASLILLLQGQHGHSFHKKSGQRQQGDDKRSLLRLDENVDKDDSGNSPIGITTPNTATVRFSPRRKFSPPAGEQREKIGLFHLNKKDT